MSKVTDALSPPDQEKAARAVPREEAEGLTTALDRFMNTAKTILT
ncbi:MAG TPA: hypothetical protein VFK86_00845 [Bauldia sp.]|nr:hypothetical protein [Bauldia sp.]